MRKLEENDVDAVVARIVMRLRDDASRNRFINPDIDLDVLAAALRGSSSATWVAYQGDRIVGHLYGAVLENRAHGRGVWIGPDGASFDDVDVLADLYAVAGQHWIDAGASEHYAWVLDDRDVSDPWLEMGFARVHRRGVSALEYRLPYPFPDGYSLRLGSLDDLDAVVNLSAELDRAQERGPSFLMARAATSDRDEMHEIVSDPDTTLYLVEHDGQIVAQCITFPLPSQRGSNVSTLHLSAVAVLERYRHYGVGAALVSHVLANGLDDGYEFADVDWRVTNRRTSNFWLSCGFTPTYVRLHRSVGAD